MTAPVRGEPVRLDPPGPEPVALGRYGEFGGRFVPETLIPALEDLERDFRAAWADDGFRAEYADLLTTYAGRPTPVTECRRLSERFGVRVLLKREDLTHTGSHKINNVLGQALLTRRMGKKRVIAETGAGQHGVATATAAALFGLECKVFMGAVDIERQALNVFRMKLLGVEAGGLGPETGKHGASVNRGVPGVLHGARSLFLQDEDGQIREAHSISAGLDYPGVGPEHAQLAATGRAEYPYATDEEAVAAFELLSVTEGIVPALEPAHAVAWLAREAGRSVPAGATVLVTLSGRGDKDAVQVAERVTGEQPAGGPRAT